MRGKVWKRFIVLLLVCCMCVGMTQLYAADPGNADDEQGAAMTEEAAYEETEQVVLPVLEKVPDIEEPVIEEPEIEEPIIEEPIIEEPVIEEPVVEEPVIEEPVVEEPVIEEPAIEEPVIEEPVIEEPAIEEPAIEEPVIEEPAVEEPVIEEPSIEEPIIEEPVIQEPVIEEPVIEEPVIEEPIIEEPVIQEPVIEEPVAEESVIEEPVAEEPDVEEPAVEEPAEEETLLIEEILEADYSIPKAEQILINETKSVYINANMPEAYYSFTPSVSRGYVFYSTSNYDTIGTLFQVSNNELVPITSNDDYGNDEDFRISSYLEAGVTYIYKVTIDTYQMGGTTYSFTVTLEETQDVVTSFSVAPVTMTAYTHGSWVGWYDTETGVYHDHVWYHYNIDYYDYTTDTSNLVYTVTYGDHTYTGDKKVIASIVGEMPWFSDNQNMDAQWDVGTYQVTAYLMGQSCTFDVTITPNPLESLSVSDVEIVQNTTGTWFPASAGSAETYFQYNIESMLDYTIVYGGKEYTIAYADFYKYFGESPTIRHTQSTEHWTVGNTYSANVYFMNQSCTIHVTIVPSELTSFTAEEISIYQGTYGTYRGAYNYQTNPWYYYYFNDMPIQFTVVKDGETYTGTKEEITSRFGGTMTAENENEQSINPWQIGEHHFTVWYLGMSTDVKVIILPSPVTKFEIETVTITEGTNGSVYIDDGIEYFDYFLDPADLQCTVTYGNVTFTGTVADLEEQSGFTVTFFDQQSGQTPWGCDTDNVVVAKFMGKGCEFLVELVPDTIDWELDDYGTLRIHSEMSNWAYSTVPWNTSRAYIRKVVIDEGITRIGSFAFADCTNLTEITVPSTIARIGAFAFQRCTSLDAISIPGGISYIEESAFANCSQLSSVTIPNNVTTIVYNTFQGCTSLVSITMPKSVKTIKPEAFLGCLNLHDVYYSGNAADKAQIVIGIKNQPLIEADWHFGEMADLSGAATTVTLSGTTYTYSGQEIKPVPTVKYNGITLTAGTDYKITYTNNVNAGTGKVTISGTGGYGGSKTASFTIKSKAVTPTVTVAEDPAVFNQNGPTEPQVIVKDGSVVISEDDYDVVYSNNTMLGTATATVTLKRNYTGSGSATFKIIFKGWYHYNGKYYYFDENGVLKTGWLYYAGNYYYLDKPSGALHTGWLHYKLNQWYYFSPTTGALQTGWQKINGKWYYFDESSGVLKNGIIRYAGKYFYLHPYLITGWVTYNGKYYYFDPYLVTGWKKIDGKWYYFDPTTGELKTGWLRYGSKFFYLSRTTGTPVTGTQYIDGRRWIFGSDGALIIN